MNIKNLFFVLVITCCFVACEEDDNSPQAISSLKIVHAVTNAPPIHVNYFGENINFAGNPALVFSEDARYTLPANLDRTIVFTSVEDTLNSVYQQSVNFNVGDIHTLFLTGQGENIEGLLLKDQLLTLSDSAVGVRFINLSPNIGTISVDFGNESDPVISDLGFRESSDFIKLPATKDIGAYLFEFKDNEGNMQASANFNPLPRAGRKPIFRNITFVLLGLVEDEGGISPLGVSQIDHY